MGIFSMQPAHAGARFRDDYGAMQSFTTACLSPVMQSTQIAEQGGQHYVA